MLIRAKPSLLALILFTSLIYSQNTNSTKNTIAVCNFTTESGLPEAVGTNLVNAFLSEMQKIGKFQIVSRSALKIVLDEQSVQQTDYVKKYIEQGKLLGARFIVTGQVGKMEYTYVLSLHLIDVESGEELKTLTREYIGRVDNLISIAKELAYEISDMPTPTPLSTPSQKTQEKIPSLPIPELTSPNVDKGNYIETYSGLNLELIAIDDSSFEMGSKRTEEGREPDEEPVHQVNLDRFRIGKYEVTQSQYEIIMQKNPSIVKNRNLPVHNVSWNDAIEFCNSLSKFTGKNYTLPTEAQWEYSCRAGQKSRFCFGDAESELDNYAWYLRNSGENIHQGGKKKPNAFGIFDIYGNVWEWCFDYYSEDFYGRSSAKEKNPVNGINTNYKVLRGGAWSSPANDCRCANRFRSMPNLQIQSVGFRIVRNP